MIGLVLVTHGRLAEEFIIAMQHVVGVQAQLLAVGIGPDDDVDARRAEVADAIERVDSGQGAILLTDLFGGTPSNLAISMLSRGAVEVIAGVNLPMLIRLATARQSMSLTDAVCAARDAGRKYISVASEHLARATCG